MSIVIYDLLARYSYKKIKSKQQETNKKKSSLSNATDFCITSKRYYLCIMYNFIVSDIT